MPPMVLNPGGKYHGASCASCALRVTTSHGEECSVVYIDGTADTHVSFEKGVCGLYIGGDRELINNPVPTVPRSVAGYIEDSKNVPTHCGNCEYFRGNPESRYHGSCAKVEGLIHFYGCCNAWEPK
jgi:hypothetical protein